MHTHFCRYRIGLFSCLGSRSAGKQAMLARGENKRLSAAEGSGQKHAATGSKTITAAKAEKRRRPIMAFFNSAITVLQTLVIALGAGLGIWGAINLLEGYGNDNPGANAHVR